MNVNENGGFSYLFPELTDKQFLVLSLYSQGTSIKQIANKQAVSEMGVRKQMDAIRKKYDCASVNDLRSIYISRTNNAIGEAIRNLIHIKCK